MTDYIARGFGINVHKGGIDRFPMYILYGTNKNKLEQKMKRKAGVLLVEVKEITTEHARRARNEGFLK